MSINPTGTPVDGRGLGAGTCEGCAAACGRGIDSATVVRRLDGTAHLNETMQGRHQWR